MMKAENPESERGGKRVPEKPPERATDMELAVFFATHIDNPCGVEISENERRSLRDFYIREAKNTLWSITDEDAYRFLQGKIDEYER